MSQDPFIRMLKTLDAVFSLDGPAATRHPAHSHRPVERTPLPPAGLQPASLSELREMILELATEIDETYDGGEVAHIPADMLPRLALLAERCK